MAHDPHIVPRVPRLTGLSWPEVAPYLEEFLKRMLASSDSVHLGLAAISTAEAGDSVLNRRHPLPHRHHFVDLVGLEAEWAPRPPRAHTHAMQDVHGALEDHDRLHLHQHPHGHPDLASATSGLADQVNLQRNKPHAHNFADLVGSQLLLPFGTVGKPALSFSAGSSTGIYTLGTGEMEFSVNATRLASFSSSAFFIDKGQLTIRNLGVDGVGVNLYDDAANILAQRNGANAQTFNIYNTFTSAANYERGFFRFSSNTLQIGTENAAPGVQRSMQLLVGTGNVVGVQCAAMQPLTDAQGGLGGASNRWWGAWLGGQAAIIPLTIREHAAQTANLTEWQNSGSTPLAYVTKDGYLSLPNGAVATPSLVFGGSATGFWRSGAFDILAASVAGVEKLRQSSQLFALRADAAQAGNIQEWWNSGGNTLSRIDKDGQTTDFVLAGQIFGP